MGGAFFRSAMRSPPRQLSFRRTAVLHAVFVVAASVALSRSQSAARFEIFSYLLLGAAIVEAAALIGWRLTQLPKSRALEFLLTAPISPKRVFAAEFAVGAGRFLWVQLAGLPGLAVLQSLCVLHPLDVALLLAYPLAVGMVAGLGLVVWAYEHRRIRRIGEFIALGGVLIYLTVGVLAAERLRDWLGALPPALGRTAERSVLLFYSHNPFGVVRFWFDPINGVPEVARERAAVTAMIAIIAAGLLYLRGSIRMVGHFQDRHDSPQSTDRADETARIGDRPLSWWAVRRVLEYSGRVNIWLAGGFSVIYSAYLIAGDQWPPYLGTMVFALFERLGGAPMLVAGLAVMAAVPAAFQYGLWDSTATDRCRRLELLLLTDLTGTDYRHASFSAAWSRGRGYAVVAMMLVGALLISGKIGVLQAVSAVSAGVILWCLAFALGFHAFSLGKPANGQGTLLTLGVPMLAIAADRLGGPVASALFPPGAVYSALAHPLSLGWSVGPILAGLAAWLISVRSVDRCETGLRSWYDRAQGSRSAAVG